MAVQKKTAKRQRLPEGFGPARGNMLARLIEAAVDEEKIPFILGLDQDEKLAGMSLIELEKKYTGITHICEESRGHILDQMEQSLIKLALGGVETERRWDKESQEWVPFKQKDVAPHFEAARWILAQWRPEQWAANRNTDDMLIFDEVMGKQASEKEIQRIERFAGRLLESCTVRREVEYTIQTKSEPSGDTGSGPPTNHALDAGSESDPGVQDFVLDVQPQGAAGDEEPAVCDLADPGQGDNRVEEGY